MPGARMSRWGLPARSAACPISSWMVSRMACWLMGSTMPLVPRTLSPPSTPMWGLKVRFAVSAPPSMEMVTSKPPAYPADSASFSSASFIMARGTWLMATSPTGWSRPGFVTRPTPSPPWMRTSPDSSGRRATLAMTGRPVVTSTSSPPSFRMAHSAPSPDRRQKMGSTSTTMPFGVRRATVSGVRPVSSSRAAPAAPSAAQVPVV